MNVKKRGKKINLFLRERKVIFSMQAVSPPEKNKTKS